MKPGIYYLYEYENANKLRNAGFLKLTRRRSFYQLKISVRNIPVHSQEPLHISMIFLEKEKKQLVPLLSVGCQERTAAALINIPDSQLPANYTLDNCDGILLTAAEKLTLAAVPSEISFDINSLTPPDETTGQKDSAEADLTAKTASGENTGNEENTSGEIALPQTPQIETSEEEHAAQTRKAEASEETHAAQTRKAKASEEAHAPASSARKIRRRELSCLPRCYWNLANNSFLLHGYHNYNHLLLIEEDGHYWLGVPGIYDPQEARAAELFGFPQFTDSYNDLLKLNPDERNDFAPFGYWCRHLPS